MLTSQCKISAIKARNNEWARGYVRNMSYVMIIVHVKWEEVK